MAVALRFPTEVVPAITESAVQDGDIVIVGSAPGKVAFPGGASPTTMLFGVVMKPDGNPANIGDQVDVVVGGIYPVRAAGVIAAKNLVTSGGANGTGIAEAAGAGTNVGVIGQALDAAVANDKVPCQINPFIKQG